MAQKANNLANVERITQTQTSCVHNKIASNLVFHVSILSFKCLEIFSTTTVELSTSIQRTNINAKRVILLIFSHIIRASKNTSHNVRGIETAVLNASFLHKYKAKTKNTITIDSAKFISSIFVAFLAVFHSF